MTRVVMAGFLTIFLLSTGPSAFGRDTVRSSEKLRLLDNATGSSTSSSSFESRLDAVFSTNAEPTRSVVARQDARNQLATQVNPYEETEVSLFTVSPEKKGLEKEKTEEESRLKSNLENVKDASNQTYEDQFQKTQEDLFEENLMRQQALSKAQEGTKTEEEEASSLPPSLAYNPFYFEPIPQSEFEEVKPILASRLMQQGWETDDIQDFLTRSSSPEDLILILMHEENYSYAEALEIVQT